MSDIAPTTALAAFRLESAPRRGESTIGAFASILSASWAGLTNEDALEMRAVVRDGHLEVFLVLRARRVSASDAETAAALLARMHGTLLAVLLPEWSWEPLAESTLTDHLLPFEPVDGADLLRREIEVVFNGDRLIDISAHRATAPGRQLGPLVDAMVESGVGTVLAITAQPVDVTEAEQTIMISELRELVSDGRVSGRTSPVNLDLAQKSLGARLADGSGLGQIRISLACSDELPEGIAALSQIAFGDSEHGLRVEKPSTEADLEVFRANLAGLDFRLWGREAVEDADNPGIGDAYLASFAEIAAAWAVPFPNGYTPMGAALIDPPPRPVPLAVPSEGLIVGDGMYGPEKRPVALSEADRSRHMYVVGQTGSGKSTLLLNLIMQDIESGMGLAVVDPHGDLVDDILLRFPKQRADDLILFDPSDTARPVGLNILESGTPAEQDFLIQTMIDMLYRIYDPGHTGIVGPRFEHWFRMGALTVMAAPDGGSLLDIPKVFTDEAFLSSVLRYVDNPPVRSFWLDEMSQTSDYHKSEMLGWFIAKFGAFTANQVMRDVVGQRRSSFSMREAMDTGKVVLVRLSKGLLGEVNLRWLGMIAVTKIQLAAMSRAAVSREERRPFGLYVDEFQNFSLGSFDQIISEARKYGLWLTMANQHVGQLPEEFRDAVFGNVGAIASFRLGADDSELMVRELAGFRPHDLTRIENYRCVLRLAVGGRVQPPFDVRTRPCSETANPDLAAAIRQLSRLTYGRPAEIVEAEVLSAYGV